MKVNLGLITLNVSWIHDKATRLYMGQPFLTDRTLCIISVESMGSINESCVVYRHKNDKPSVLEAMRQSFVGAMAKLSFGRAQRIKMWEAFYVEANKAIEAEKKYQEINEEQKQQALKTLQEELYKLCNEFSAKFPGIDFEVSVSY